jgi:NCS1 family nucleobase:cation symporter-1
LVASLGDTDISWIIGLVVPAAMYYLAARKWHSAVPDRLILPVEQGAVIEKKLSGAGRAASV